MSTIYEQSIKSYIDNYNKKSVVILDSFETLEEIKHHQHIQFVRLTTKYNNLIHVKINEYHKLHGELPYDIKMLVDGNEFRFINFDKSIKRWFYVNVLNKQLYYSPRFIFVKMINEIHKMNAHIHDYKAIFDGKTIHLIRK